MHVREITKTKIVHAILGFKRVLIHYGGNFLRDIADCMMRI